MLSIDPEDNDEEDDPDRAATRPKHPCNPRLKQLSAVSVDVGVKGAVYNNSMDMPQQ